MDVRRVADLLQLRGIEGACASIATALARTGQQGPFYIFAAFIFTYGTTVLHSTRDLLLAAVMVATMLSAVTIPLAGHISDRVGRKRMYLIGIAAIGMFSFVYFALLNTAIPAVIFFAIILSFIPHDMAYGQQAALIAECFPPRLLQRLLAWLSSGIDHRGRAGTANRDRAARLDRLGLFNRPLYSGFWPARLSASRRRSRYRITQTATSRGNRPTGPRPSGAQCRSKPRPATEPLVPAARRGAAPLAFAPADALAIQIAFWLTEIDLRRRDSLPEGRGPSRETSRSLRRNKGEKGCPERVVYPCGGDRWFESSSLQRGVRETRICQSCKPLDRQDMV